MSQEQYNTKYQNVKSIPFGLYKPGVHIGCCFSPLPFVALQSLRRPQVISLRQRRRSGLSIWLYANLGHLHTKRSPKGPYCDFGGRSFSTFAKKKNQGIISTPSYLRGRQDIGKSQEIHKDVLWGRNVWEKSIIIIVNYHFHA